VFYLEVSKRKSKVERPPLEPAYTVKEVAAAIGVDIDFIYDEIARGNLVATKYNARVIRIPATALEAYGWRDVRCTPDREIHCPLIDRYNPEKAVNKPKRTVNYFCRNRRRVTLVADLQAFTPLSESGVHICGIKKADSGVKGLLEKRNRCRFI
jgi:excisionase family DNA binding protein